MLQKFILPYLNKILGQYFQDFNKKNLTIAFWSGNIVLQNIRIKKQILVNLGFPLEIKYSYIKTIILKIPWKSITKSKTIINLQGLYIIVSQIPQQKWQFFYQKLGQKRKNLIDDLTQRMLNKFDQKKKEKQKKNDNNKESGRQKLILKIIQNLQLEIKDIHILFEDIKSQYSFGVSLEKFKVDSLNKKGTEDRIDKSKSEPLRKKFDLMNLGFYFNSKSERLHKIFTNDEIGQQLKKRIEKKQNKTANSFVFLINTLGKFSRIQKQQYIDPEVKVQIDINKIKIDLTKHQLEIIIQLYQFFNKYTYWLKKKNKIVLGIEQQYANLSHFKSLYSKYFQNQFSFKNVNDQNEYLMILSKIDMSKLFPIIKAQIKAKLRKKILKKQKKKRHWFTSANKQISDQQLDQIQQFLDKNLESNIKSKRPKSYYFLQFRMILQQLQIALRYEDEWQSQGLSVKLTNMNLRILVREQGFKSNFVLSSMKMNIVKFTKAINSTQITNFFNKLPKQQEQHYLELQFTKNPLDKDVQFDIKLKINPVIITFSPMIFTILTNFIQLKTDNLNKYKISEKIDEFKYFTDKNLITPLKYQIGNKYSIEIVINAPIIILPFKGNSEQYCWSICLGKIDIYTQNLMNKKNKYRIQLNELNLGWFQSKNQLLNYLFANNNNVIMDKILDNIQLCVDIEISKEQQSKQEPSILIKGYINQLNINLSKFSYDKLLEFQKCFQVPIAYKPHIEHYNEQKVSKYKYDRINEEAIKQKKQIMQKSDKFGLIYKKNLETNVWSKYMGILNNNYIYLYEKKKSIKYDEYIYIKNCNIQTQIKQQTAKKFCIKLTNELQKQYLLAFHKKEFMQEWIQILNQKQDTQQLLNMSDIDSEQDFDNIKKANKIEYTKIKTQADFEITKMEIKLYQTNPKKVDLNILISKFIIECSIYAEKMLINLNVNSLQIMDFIYQYKNNGLDYFIKSSQSQFLKISIYNVKPGHPEFDQTNNKIKIIIGAIDLNLKTQIIRNLMQFLMKQSDIMQQCQNDSKINDSNSNQEYSVKSSTANEFPNKTEASNRILMDLDIYIESISIYIINNNIKIKQYSVFSKELQLSCKKFTQQMIIKGNLNNLIIMDHSNYPNTIIKQQDYIQNSFSLLRLQSQESQNLLYFQALILNTPNLQNKQFIFDLHMQNIRIFYLQQPTLRILDNLLSQILPSLSTKTQQQIIRERKSIQVPKQSKLLLKINMTNIQVSMKPVVEKNKFIIAKIGKLNISNNSLYKNYTRSGNKSIIVENYKIILQKIKIGSQQKQLTNPFNFEISIDLISCPLYYKIYQPQDFIDGYRIYCHFTPIILNINHDQYQLIFKCLNYNIILHDNCDELLYREKYLVYEKVDSIKQNQEQSIGMFINLQMDMIKIVGQQNQQAFICLQLNWMQIKYTKNFQSMKIDLAINNIKGNYFVNKFQKRQQRNLFNSNVRCINQINQQKLSNANNHILLKFQVNQILSKYLEITIQHIFLNVQLKILLKFAQFLQLNNNDKVSNDNKQLQKKQSKMQIKLVVYHFKLLFAHPNISQHLIVQGQIFLLVQNVSLSNQYILQICKKRDLNSQIENGKLNITINNIMVYFISSDNNKIIRKRNLLKPLNMLIIIKKLNSLMGNKICITTQYTIKIQSIYLQSVVQDLFNISKLNQYYLNIYNQVNHVQNYQHKRTNTQLIIQNSKEEMVHDLRTNINIEYVEFTLLNHYENNFIPVIKIQISEINPILKMNFLLTRMSLIIFIQINYFNSRTLIWEPVLQKYSFLTEYISVLNPKVRQSRIIIHSNDQIKYNSLNFNISTQFIASLVKILASIPKQGSERNQIYQPNQLIKSAMIGQQLDIQISSYVFENFTWQYIQLIIEKQIKLKKKSSIRQIQKDSNENKILIKFQPRSKKSIYVPNQTSQIVIRIDNIDYKINIKKLGKKKIPGSNYLIQFLAQDFTRTIKLIPTKILINKMNKKILIQLQQKGLIELNKDQSVPLDDVNYMKIGNQIKQLSQQILINAISQFQEVSNRENKFHINLIKKTQIISNSEFFTLEIYAPFIFRNNLPKPMLFQLIYNKKSTFTKQLNSQTSFQINRHKSKENFHFKINLQGFFWTEQIGICENMNKEIDLILRDRNNDTLTIKVSITIGQSNQNINLNFYTVSYIINETQFELVFYAHKIKEQKKSKKKYFAIAGQQKIEQRQMLDLKILLIGSQVGTNYKIKDANNQKLSSQISAAGINFQQIEIQTFKIINQVRKKILIVLGVVIEIKIMDKVALTITKQIRILPRNIVYNHSNQSILIFQYGSNQLLFRLQPQQREILFFIENQQSPQKIFIKTELSQNSSEFSFNQNGVINFYINQLNKKKYYRIDVRITDKYRFGVIQKIENNEDIPYQIINLVEQFNIRIRQLHDQIIKIQKLDFSWKNPEESHQITLQFLHKYTDEVLTSLEINPDNINFSKKLIISTDHKVFQIEVYISFIKQKKIITIKKVLPQQIQNNLLRIINFHINNIGLSIIVNHSSQKNYEAFFFTIQQFEFINKTTQLLDEFQLKLRFFQIDQNNTYQIRNPVIITPQKFKQYTNPQGADNLFNLLIQRDRKTLKSVILKKVILQLGTLTTRITQLLILLLFDLFKQFSTAIQTKKYQYVIEMLENQWKNFIIPSQRNSVFIQQIISSPLQIQFTIQLKPQSNSKRFFLFQIFLATFGVAITNIQQAPLYFNGFKLTNCFDSPSRIFQKLYIYYKPIILREVSKVFGSLNFIGNPNNLFKNISTGLTDLIKKPAQGIIKGPIQLGQGIALGAGSLITHTLGGAFNSVQKITGGISTGLTVLCFDKEFQNLRLNQKLKKPKNFLQGIAKGSKALFIGVKQGLVGVILKPYQGGKKQGFLGLLKGTAKGISGLVIKPVTGILDMTSKTTQGFKNTALYFDDKANQNRMRYPRAFYGQNLEIKQYIQFDAQIVNMLKFIKKPSFSKSFFYEGFMIQKNILVVLDRNLVMLNVEKKNIIWQILINNIKAPLNQTQIGIVIILKQKSKFFKNNNLIIEIQDQYDKKTLIKLLKQLIDQNA